MVDSGLPFLPSKSLPMTSAGLDHSPTRFAQTAIWQGWPWAGFETRRERVCDRLRNGSDGPNPCRSG